MPAPQQTITLKVSYFSDLSGATNLPSSQTKSETISSYPAILSITLSNTRPTLTGYDFVGWSNAFPPTAVTNAPGSTYSRTFTTGMTSIETSMWAVWRRKTYTVSYNKGSNGSGTNTSDTKTYGYALTLKGAIFTRSGYKQVGWATSDGGAKEYDLGASYTTNADITLYPVWEQDVNAYVKVNGVWKRCSNIYVKVGGVWKSVINAFTKVGGTWKPS